MTTQKTNLMEANGYEIPERFKSFLDEPFREVCSAQFDEMASQHILIVGDGQGEEIPVLEELNKVLQNVCACRLSEHLICATSCFLSRTGGKLKPSNLEISKSKTQYTVLENIQFLPQIALPLLLPAFNNRRIVATTSKQYCGMIPQDIASRFKIVITDSQEPQWISLKQAAKLYSRTAPSICLEDAESSLLEGFLSGALKPSVLFHAPVLAKRGKFFPSDQIGEAVELSTAYRARGSSISVHNSSEESWMEVVGLEDLVFAYTDGVARSINGLWDLAMIGNELPFVQNLYREKAQNSSIPFRELDAFYVRAEADGEYWEIQIRSVVEINGKEQEITCPASSLSDTGELVIRGTEWKRFLRGVVYEEPPVVGQNSKQKPSTRIKKAEMEAWLTSPDRPEDAPEYDEAWEELERLDKIQSTIEDLRTANETDSLTKKGILEREILAIKAWVDGKRESPTIGDKLLAAYNLESTREASITHKGNGDDAILVPRDTEWGDITFRFIDTNSVEITVSRKKYRRSFKSFDFSYNSRKRAPTKPWLHLLNLAVHKGNPPRRGSGTDTGKSHVSNLRYQLRKIFPGVPGAPIGNYARGKGWPLNIHLCVSDKLLSDARR